MITNAIRWPTQAALHNPPYPWKPLPACFPAAKSQQANVPEGDDPLLIIPCQTTLTPPGDLSWQAWAPVVPMDKSGRWVLAGLLLLEAAAPPAFQTRHPLDARQTSQRHPA